MFVKWKSRGILFYYFIQQILLTVETIDFFGEMFVMFHVVGFPTKLNIFLNIFANLYSLCI